MEIRHSYNDLQNDHLVLYDLIKLTNETNKTNLIQCVFISGLSHNECSPIPNTGEYSSICKHKKCYLNVNAFLPNVLFYLEKNPKIINPDEQTAKLVFPTGIKPCLHISKTFPSNETFTNNIITTLKGDRFYIYSIIFYIAFNIEEFKRFFDYMKFNISSFDNEDNNNIIGLPFAISIVTINSNFIEMKPLLQELYYSFKCTIENTDKFDNDIMHFIYELPIPMNNSIMHIYLPFVKTDIYSQDIAQNEYDLQLKQYVFTYLSLENIITVFALLITEQKIIFICEDSSILYNIIEIFMSLIYPLKWVTTYIPIIPEDSTSYIQSFIPFVMGITMEVFENRVKNVKIEGGIYEVNIDKDSIEYYEGESYERKNAEKYCPYYKVLLKQLSKWENMKNKEIKECFVKCMYDMIGEYESYTTNIVDNNLFDQNMYVKNKDNLYEEFYRDLTSTQMFNQFIQSTRETDKELFRECNECDKKDTNIEDNDNYEEHFEINDNNEENENNIITTDYNNRKNIFSIHYNESNYDNNLLENIEHYHLYPYFFPKDKETCIHIDEKIQNYYSNLYYNIKNLHKSNNETFLLPSDYFFLFQIIMKNYDEQTPIKRYLFYSHDSLSFIEPNDDTYTEFNTNPPSYIPEESPEDSRNSNSFKREEYENKINLPSSHKQVPYKKQNSIINMVIECPVNKEAVDKRLEPYHEQICEVLKDYMTSIFVNSNEFRNSLGNISKFFVHSFIRSEFAYILYQEKFNENIQHELSESTFNELSKVVFYCLLNSNNEQQEFETLRLMTKALFYYFRNGNEGNVIYLYQDIIGKGIVFDYWKEVKFWEYFYKENTIENPLENQYAVINDYMRKLNLNEILINYIQKRIFE